MLRFDHLAVSATSLEDGVCYVEEALGLRLAPGGKHPHMATHNRLITMGDTYIEVIAPDPVAPAPNWPRWFDLDNFKGTPRLTNWVVASDDLLTDLEHCPEGTGVPVALARGDFQWQMAVPADGKLPFDGAFPALIMWLGPVHPAKALPDQGLVLTRLEIAHPEGDLLSRILAPMLAPTLADQRVFFVNGPQKQFRASFMTPHGPRVLQ
jgi:hypothetical protein